MKKPKRATALAYISLLANVVLFFYKPLFNSQYLFPWDFRGVQLPLITFLTDQLRAGRFALWNPYSYCGYPVFANIEACFFHPLVFAAALISSRTSLAYLPILLEWVVVLHIWVAGIATYHLFQNFGAGRASSWTAAIMFETGGYFASRAEHIGAIMAVCWMPLAWLAVLKLRERRDPAWLAALAAALGMSVLGGFPQPTLAVFVSVAAISLFLVLGRLARRALLIDVAIGCIGGIALSAIQFLPTAQLARNSVARYRAGWLGTGGGLRWESLISLVSPDHYHLFDMSRFKGPGDMTFLYLYSSIAGLLFAVLGIFCRRTRHTYVLVAMLLFGMIFMLGDQTLVWRLLYPLLPDIIRTGIHPEYSYCIFTLSLAGLAAYGLESLPVAERLRYLAGTIIALDLFFVGSGRPMNCVSAREDPGVTRQAFDGSSYLLDEVRRHTEQSFPPWRIDTTDDASMGWSWGAPLTRVPIANGISPLALENIIQLRLFLHDGYRWGWYYPVAKFDSPVLDLLNVRYLIAGPQAADRLRALAKFREVEWLPGGSRLFENLSAAPRFFLVHDARLVRSPDEAKELIGRREIDLRQSATVEGAVQLRAGNTPVTGDVRVLSYEPDSLRLSVTGNSAALLVLSENYYPGWKAWLDDIPAAIYRTDIAFRGVVIPAGAHTLRMEFHPVIFPISAAISLATAILLIGLSIPGWRRA